MFVCAVFGHDPRAVWFIAADGEFITKIGDRCSRCGYHGQDPEEWEPLRTVDAVRHPEQSVAIVETRWMRMRARVLNKMACFYTRHEWQYMWVQPQIFGVAEDNYLMYPARICQRCGAGNVKGMHAFFPVGHGIIADQNVVARWVRGWWDYKKQTPRGWHYRAARWVRFVLLRAIGWVSGLPGKVGRLWAKVTGEAVPLDKVDGPPACKVCRKFKWDDRKSMYVCRSEYCVGGRSVYTSVDHGRREWCGKCDSLRFSEGGDGLCVAGDCRWWSESDPVPLEEGTVQLVDDGGFDGLGVSCSWFLDDGKGGWCENMGCPCGCDGDWDSCHVNDDDRGLMPECEDCDGPEARGFSNCAACPVQGVV